MNHAMRYALYLMPDPDTALWQTTSALLGYDSVTGKPVVQPEIAGVGRDALRAATLDPRRYGFHLTLKAPFRLASGQSEDTLIAALDGFCAKRSRVDLGALALEARRSHDDRGFVCLVPKASCAALVELEREAVLAFERFRAPLDAAEIARRQPETLTPRQRILLELYGYPFVLEEFRPHFSLTGAIDDPTLWCAALQKAFVAQPQALFCVAEGITLCRQPAPDAPFVVLHQARLGA